ncbi:alpha/beta hydrolase [Maioricimonas sp. JC845]|uniref:alpha/beta hydrolase n=1 Tax=Maioricimonas sp. JC845 TaxID=3232138 RepID=UPI00345AC792
MTRPAPRLLSITCLILSIAGLLTIATVSRGGDVVSVWPGDPPGPPALVDGPERNRQRTDDRLVAGKPVIRLTNVANAEVHVFTPPADRANGAACVVCPGGGFSILAWDLEGTEVAEWLNSIGVTAFVLKYRVPTRQHGEPGTWQGPVMDAQRTLSLVRSRAGEWGIDPERVGILGFSAGGQTAALTAVRNGDRLYEPVDSVDEHSCAADFAILVYPARIADAAGQLDGKYTVTEKTPPMFFVHAADDRVSCLNSVALFAALKQSDVPAELHIYHDGGHGFGLRETSQAVTHWPQRAAAWLREMELLSGGADADGR